MKIIRLNTTSFYLAALFVVHIVSCKNEKCPEFKTFSSLDEAPLIWTKSKNDDACSYKIEMSYSNEKERAYQSEGIMYLSEQKLILRLFEPETDEFMLFDFSKKKGDEYVSEVHYKALENQTKKFKIKVEDIIRVKEEDVYIFRIADSYSFMDEFLDEVYFVTQENGVIGSYMSLGSALEYFAYPRGNVLPEIIDYSKKKSGILL